MLKALSTRRSYRRYERLVVNDSAVGLLEGNLKRSTTLPAVPSLYSKLPSELYFPDYSKVKQPRMERKRNMDTHLLFSLFDSCRKKKTTAKPEFTRYLEYLKEGGVWDENSNTPVIYCK